MVIITIITLLIITGAVLAYLGYQIVFTPNVWTEDQKEQFIYIQTDDDFEAVKNQLYANGNIIHRKNFELLADYKKYGLNINSFMTYYIGSTPNKEDIIVTFIIDR